MSTELIIAEKPSVMRDIAQALGGFSANNGYMERPGTIITHARGHLVEIGIPKSEDPGWDLTKLPVVPAPFHLFAIKGCNELLDRIGYLAERKDVTKIVNACDAGREGELIFRLVIGYLGIKKPSERMWLQSMTAAGIKTAFANRRTDAQMRPLADAAVSRSESDWLIGINATRTLTKSDLFGTDELVSAGRVQTPVLTLVVDREAAITTFKAREFWEVSASLRVSAGAWDAKLYVKPSSKGDKESGDAEESLTRFFDKGQASQIVSQCTGLAPTSTTEITAPSHKAPPLPFDLTTLQRTANARLGFSAKKTLDIAQNLYEKYKVTTYPRTDSSYLPEDYAPKVNAVLGAINGPNATFAQEILTNNWVIPKHRAFNNAKISDHFAIIPTGKNPEGLTRDEQQLFDMIQSRFIATFFPAAEFSKTTRDTVIGQHTFRAVGTVMNSPGWLKVYGGASLQDDDDGKKKTPDVVLPLCKQGEVAKNEAIKLHSGKTKPPPRYTEATLLGAMETAGKLVDDEDLRDAMSERGLGTPATRAATIEELLSERKNYLVREKKQLVPTQKAIALVAALRKCGLELLTSPELTGDWEHQLAQMEKGTIKRTEFMKTVRDTTHALVDKIKAHAAT